MAMTTGDAAKQLDVSQQTIRNWLKQFDGYFEDAGTLHNNITQDGFILLATISELSKGGLKYDDIRQQLRNGYRTENLEQYALPNDVVAIKEAITNAEFLAKAAADRRELQIAQQEITRLSALLQNALDQNKEQAEEIKRLNEEVKSLYERIIKGLDRPAPPTP